MEEMGRRFSGAMVLTERESKGVRIRASAVQSALRCQFALNWGGDDGVRVSVVEGDRFLARFTSEKDMLRVLDREPWDFDKSLVTVGMLGNEGAVTDVSLETTVFWVQIHGVPVQEVQDPGQLLLEGPLTDTASSPCKSEDVKAKSKGAIIAERFATRQRVLREEGTVKGVAKVLFPEKATPELMVLAPTVDNTAMHLSKKLHLNVVSSETSIQKVQQMGQLLKSGLIGNRSLEGKALEMKVENVQSISALARKEDDGPFLFKMGSTQCKSEVGVLKKERKVVKVANKCRKQDLAPKLVPSVLVLGGGRKT
ncbi:hypothetical protein M0R45_000374 [Rubus argutus]|uniref:DUF4283 domain-containing protein n=1 Tax=Rubus argutus TaxID=59490 RepID=A0AAW1VN03_RUBAR